MPATAQRFEYICHDCGQSHFTQLDMLPNGWNRSLGVHGELIITCSWCQNGDSQRGHGKADPTISDFSETGNDNSAPKLSPYALTPLKRLMVAVDVAAGRINNLSAAEAPDSESIARAVEQYQSAHFELSAEVERLTGVAPLILIRALSL